MIHKKKRQTYKCYNHISFFIKWDICWFNYMQFCSE